MTFCLPAHISPEQFLRDYWQKKPLLIRQGMPEIVNEFEPEDILNLALENDIHARLVKQYSPEHWELCTSPLSRQDFNDLPAQWSVLVQNMEQWSTELGSLWQKFAFIPQWQRDDIMVSFAPRGGSVGRHYDEYDVFLVQAYGHRRWQLGKWCSPETEFKPDQPIRIFDDMGEIIFDEVLAPGDVLYVPSRLAHYGVAQDDCLTFSFGLRYPNFHDLLGKLQDALAYPRFDLSMNDFNLPLRLTPPRQKSGKLDDSTVALMKAQLIDMISRSQEFDQLFRHAVATTVSERRYEILVAESIADPDEVRSDLENNGLLVQDNNCKLVYTENPLRVYANGEWLDEISSVEAEVLKALADGESLDIRRLNALLHQNDHSETAAEMLLDSICNWLDDGWVILLNAETNE